MVNEKYYELFKNIAHTVETTSEQVMEYNSQNKDEKGEKTAQTMRDDFAGLYDRLSQADYNVTRTDYMKLLVGAFVVLNLLENNKKAIDVSIHGYKSDVLPKLQRIMNESDNDESAAALAEKIFEINT